MKAHLLALVPAFWLCEASAQELLRVSAQAWRDLAPEERAAIQRVRMVEIREAGTMGLIIDTQGVNESTPATSGGAALGGALADAAYTDRALKPGNSYSAKTQLGATLLGALAGSAFDARSVPRFHFRYAVKLPDGEIRMVDAIQTDAFRLPIGMCVTLPELLQISQGSCTHTAADLRRLYLGPLPLATPATSAPEAHPASSQTPMSAAPPFASTVTCSLGSLPPVQTTAEKCNSIGGDAR